MRLTTKLIFSFIFLLLASSLLVTHGCGKRSGGCPDSVAPAGSTITAPTIVTVPSTTTSTCAPTLGFTVIGPDGSPSSDTCVEIYSDASIALHTGSSPCSNVAANPQSAIVTRTDGSGNVIVEMLMGPTPAGATHFVEVASGAIANTATTPGAK